MKRYAIYVCGGHPVFAIPNPACPLAESHTPAPEGYLDWHEWADEKALTHDNRRCEGCGLFALWVPREQPA